MFKGLSFIFYSYIYIYTYSKFLLGIKHSIYIYGYIQIYSLHCNKL